MIQRICSVEDCEIKHYARSYCRKHYNKWMKYNNPLAGGQRYSSPDESLARRVKKNGNCSVWTGYKNHLGYGYIWVGSKSRSVHRYVWEQAYGPIPPGKEIDHKCWNRACVNLDHLRVVSRSENNRYLSSAEKSSTSGARNVYHQTANGLLQLGSAVYVTITGHLKLSRKPLWLPNKPEKSCSASSLVVANNRHA